ncbi:MAG: DoxX family protein [Cyanobacteria bacterium P01_C01_bin.73]
MTFTQFKPFLKLVLAVMMVTIGILHFVDPDPFVQIVPPFLPAPLALVYISGALEIALGLILLIPQLQTWAAWGLIALFIAVFPANIYMAVANVQVNGLPNNPLLYWLRLPLQAVLIAWAYWFTRPKS